MDGKRVEPLLDSVIFRLAAGQHGVVARGQLLARGIGGGAIDYRLRSGRLHQIHRGVYSLGPPSALRRQSHWMAAVLACGEGAVLSHAAAAALWDLRRSSAPTVDVTVPRPGGARRRRGIRLHRSTTLDAGQRTVRDAIPVTSVPRTIIDLADRFDQRTTERALDQAEVLRLFDGVAFDATIEANPGRRGAAVVARLLETYRVGEQITDTELEDEFLRLCERFGIPRPEVQAPTMGGGRLDFLWRAQRVVVEVDGWRWHGGRAARDRDNERDANLQAGGFKAARFSRRRIARRPEAVAASVTALLQS